MRALRRVLLLLLACGLGLDTSTSSPQPQQAPAAGQREPYSGQPGKDVVWVPTSPALVEKMLDMAQVRPDDFVVDLGSGDGRNVIAAAKRGARGLGVEFNPDMVALSRRIAAREGVADRATFVEGDMYAADFSTATVLALFLLPNNLEQLRPKFLNLAPGTRIVANTFGIPGWEADRSETLEGDCESWCTSLLWIVPAKVHGSWRLGDGQLAIEQTFQKFSGRLTRSGRRTPVEQGTLGGSDISFVVAGDRYTGRVNGDTMAGTVTRAGALGTWRAVRQGN